MHSVLFQSPVTVKEKLDVMYDIANMCNKFVDGIDIHSATMIFSTVLRHHLVYLPFNELQNLVEQVFNQGEVCGVVAAYWTRKMAPEVKYDIARDAESGFIALEDFLGQTIDAKDISRYQTIDLTREFQETFLMYQNLYGNKVLDFNDVSSPFTQLNQIFASTGRGNLGTLLLDKVN